MVQWGGHLEWVVLLGNILENGSQSKRGIYCIQLFIGGTSLHIPFKIIDSAYPPPSFSRLISLLKFDTNVKPT